MSERMRQFLAFLGLSMHAGTLQGCSMQVA